MKKSTIFSAAILVATLAVISSPNLPAQETGTITGKVLDGSSGEPVIGAPVKVVGTKLGALTNTSGTYTIKRVPAGTYSLNVSAIGYTAKTVEGVSLDAGGTARQDISLTLSSVQTGEVTVVGKVSRQAESAALIERKRSTQVSDAISAEQMSRAPSSDAGDAMKRVTGVSVVGDKYVVVRGLSERYSATQLNGVNLPSPEPEKKVVPFDLFPTSMVSRLTTIKTFTPDNPGDFAGGLVKITTKEFPEAFLLNFSIGTGINTATQGESGLSYLGGGTDYLGIDDGTRALPDGIPFGRRENAEERAELLDRFSNNVWVPTSTSLPINQSYNFSIGNQIDVGVPLGFLVSGSYANSFNFREESQAYPLLEMVEGRQSRRYDYTGQRAERSILWGGLFNLSAQLAPEHKVSFKAIYNHSSDDESRVVSGIYNQSSTQELRFTRLRFLERTLTSLQLDGEHQIEELLNSKIDWRVAQSSAERGEPDNRSTTYTKNADGVYQFINNFGSNNGRFFSDLFDTERNAGLDWSIPFTSFSGEPGRVKVGGLGRFRDREFDARRFVFTATGQRPELLTLAPEELFTPQMVLDGVMAFDDETQSTDNYAATERIIAGYAMVDLPLGSGLRFVGGARVEQWTLGVESVNPMSGTVNDALTVDRDQTDILPSANLIYSVNDEMNIRTSVTQTLARPEFRELAPFRFDDYRQSSYGNPSLQRTTILNLDGRWEWFPRGGEVIAASAFYKIFTNPIEQFYLIGSGISVEPANASDATTFGAELELRKALDFIAPELIYFSVGSNLTLVKSEVTFTEGDTVAVFDGIGMAAYSPAALTSTSRPLQGQSPYVVNVMLGYDNPDLGTGVTLLYNVFGRRLAFVGTQGIPDAYEQPRNSIDLTITQQLPAGLQLKLSARNLLDEETVIDQQFPAEVFTVERYRSGRSFSLSVGFSLDQLQP